MRTWDNWWINEILIRLSDITQGLLTKIKNTWPVLKTYISPGRGRPFHSVLAGSSRVIRVSPSCSNSALRGDFLLRLRRRVILLLNTLLRWILLLRVSYALLLCIKCVKPKRHQQWTEAVFRVVVAVSFKIGKSKPSIWPITIPRSTSAVIPELTQLVVNLSKSPSNV